MRNYFEAMIRNHRRRNAYRSLLQLDEHLLDDIGLTKSHLDVLIGGKSGPDSSRKSSDHE